jgi:hypothetical protein
VTERVNSRNSSYWITNESIEVGVAVCRSSVDVLSCVDEENNFPVRVDTRDCTSDASEKVIDVAAVTSGAVVAARYADVGASTETSRDATHVAVDASTPNVATGFDREISRSV